MCIRDRSYNASTFSSAAGSTRYTHLLSAPQFFVSHDDYDLGMGWRHSFSRRVMRVDPPEGLSGPSLTYFRVYRPDGKVKYFYLYEGQIVGDKDETETLTATSDGYLFRTKDWLEQYDTVGLWTGMRSREGRSIQVTRDEAMRVAHVVDQFGRGVSVSYDEGGMLTSLSPSAGGSVGYTRDLRLNLSGVSFPDGSTNVLHYEKGSASTGVNAYYRFTGVTDENNTRFSTFDYDTFGRATVSSHAGGAQVGTVLNGSSNGTYHNWNVLSTLTNSLGHSTTVYYQPVAGIQKLKSATAFCPECGILHKAWKYDLNGNTSERDDFNGRRECFSHDARNREVVHLEGSATTTTCAASLAAASLPQGVRKTSRVWHPDWQIEVNVAGPGRIVTSVYNGQPDPFNNNVTASCAPGTALLPDGKPIAVLCKRVEQATTDATGAAGFGAALQPGVTARQWAWTYNGVGQVLTEDGPRTDVSDITVYEYHGSTTADYTLGDLKKVTNAAGKATQFTKYNAHGQVLESQDPNGAVTVNTYDQRQRLLTSAVGGLTTSYTYDLVGLLKKVTLPDGSFLGYDHDDAHRLISTYDHKGNRTDYQLDSAGNRINEETKDPNGGLRRQLSRSANALGRIQQVTGRE